MTFTESKEYVIPFGKFKWKKLDAIAQTDDGLMYLDYMSGELGPGSCREAIEAYLSDPGIQKDLAKLVGRGAQS